MRDYDIGPRNRLPRPFNLAQTKQRFPFILIKGFESLHAIKTYLRRRGNTYGQKDIRKARRSSCYRIDDKRMHFSKR